MAERVQDRRWWSRSAFLLLALAQTLWSLFWWVSVDARVVDGPLWVRIALWAGGLALLAGASARSDVCWYDPLDTWGRRDGEPRPPAAVRRDTPKRLLLSGAVLVGVLAPWLMTATTVSPGVRFALGVRNTMNQENRIEERRSVTRLQRVARVAGGDARIVRVDEHGTSWVTVWDRPAARNPDREQPPPHPGNSACIALAPSGASRISEGECPG